MLRRLADGHTRSVLLGQALPPPILIAPMAYQRLWHDDGEQATALAAAMQGAGLVLSAQSSTRLETVATKVLPEPGRGPLWFQLCWQQDRGATLALLQRAEAAGYEALVLTVDAPCSGARDRERHARFHLPVGMLAVNLPSTSTVPAPRKAQADPASQGVLCNGLRQHAPTWDDMQWLRGATRLPLLLKGVLHPDDAAHAQAPGVAGLIVSDHGGRTLDGAVATAQALPHIARRLGGAMPLLVDGGIRLGTEVLKALALGAHAVLWRRRWPWVERWRWRSACACCAASSRSPWRCAAAPRWRTSAPRCCTTPALWRARHTPTSEYVPSRYALLIRRQALPIIAPSLWPQGPATPRSTHASPTQG